MRNPAKPSDDTATFVVPDQVGEAWRFALGNGGRVAVKVYRLAGPCPIRAELDGSRRS